MAGECFFAQLEGTPLWISIHLVTKHKVQIFTTAVLEVLKQRRWPGFRAHAKMSSVATRCPSYPRTLRGDREGEERDLLAFGTN